MSKQFGKIFKFNAHQNNDRQASIRSKSSKLFQSLGPTQNCRFSKDQVSEKMKSKIDCMIRKKQSSITKLTKQHEDLHALIFKIKKQLPNALTSIQSQFQAQISRQTSLCEDLLQQINSQKNSQRFKNLTCSEFQTLLNNKIKQRQDQVLIKIQEKYLNQADQLSEALRKIYQNLTNSDAHHVQFQNGQAFTPSERAAMIQENFESRNSYNSEARQQIGNKKAKMTERKSKKIQKQIKSQIINLSDQQQEKIQQKSIDSQSGNESHNLPRMRNQMQSSSSPSNTYVFKHSLLPQFYFNSTNKSNYELTPSLRGRIDRRRQNQSLSR